VTAIAWQVYRRNAAWLKGTMRKKKKANQQDRKRIVVTVEMSEGAMLPIAVFKRWLK